MSGSAGFRRFDSGLRSEISGSRSPAPIDANGGLQGKGTRAGEIRRRSPGRHSREKARPGISAFRSHPRLVAAVRHFPRLRTPTGYRPPSRLADEGEEPDPREPFSGRGRIGRLPSSAVGMRFSRTLANFRFMPFAQAPAERCRGQPARDALPTTGREMESSFRRNASTGASRRRDRFGDGRLHVMGRSRSASIVAKALECVPATSDAS